MDTALSEPGTVTPPVPVFARAPGETPAPAPPSPRFPSSDTTASLQAVADDQLGESFGTVLNFPRERLPNRNQNFTVSLPFGWRGHWGRCGAIGCIGSKLDREKMPPNGKETVKFSTLLGRACHCVRAVPSVFTRNPSPSAFICVNLRLIIPLIWPQNSF